MRIYFAVMSCAVRGSGSPMQPQLYNICKCKKAQTKSEFPKHKNKKNDLLFSVGPRCAQQRDCPTYAPRTSPFPDALGSIDTSLWNKRDLQGGSQDQAFGPRKLSLLVGRRKATFPALWLLPKQNHPHFITRQESRQREGARIRDAKGIVRNSNC